MSDVIFAKKQPILAVSIIAGLEQIRLHLPFQQGRNVSMKIRNWTHVIGWTFGWTTLLVALAIPLTKAFEPEEQLTDIAVQSGLIGYMLCLPVFGFICYQSLVLNRTRDALADLVNRDRLTNVATRDYFYARLADNPDGYGVSLMVDIDYFKKINDTYGHLAGDVVIARVAQLIDACIRPQDIICRFGGEEFVVFLSQASQAEGQDAAERIRTAVAQNEIVYADDLLSVTVSVGGSLVDAARDIDPAIRRADMALYEAKRGGRNRVVWEDTTDEQLQDEVFRNAG